MSGCASSSEGYPGAGMLRDLWRALRTVFIVVGLLLCFFAWIEVLRAYQILAALHPVCGYVFAGLLAALLLWLALYYAVTVSQRPVVLPPAKHPDLLTAPAGEIRQYVTHLIRVMRRLSRNSLLPDERRERLKDGVLMLEQAGAGFVERRHLSDTVLRCETGIVEPAVAALDSIAEKEIRRCVRDVMVGVTLSPWRSADLLVVLYRNAGMVLRIVRIYDSRPRVREQAIILRDVLTVVATVNYLNYGSKLLQNLTVGVPVLGRFTDDIAQGVGAGLLTSVTGRAALGRCSSFQSWSEREMEETIHGKLRGFVQDVKGIVTEDILPRLRRPVEAQARDEELRPDLLERVRDGIGKAIDETAEVMDTFARKPVAAAGRGVATTGSVLGTATARGVASVWHGTMDGGRHVGRVAGHTAVSVHRAVRSGVLSVARTVGKGGTAAVGGAASVARRLTRRGRKRSPSDREREEDATGQ